MDLQGIGYSNIRLPNDNSSYVYTYDSRINTFPEEVFIHEFLHSLERILQERNYEIPALHDNEKYGYEEQRLIGLKNWYKDYMNCNIQKSNGDFTGLDSSVYMLTPPGERDFQYSLERDFNEEPSNIIAEAKGLFETALKIFVKE